MKTLLLLILSTTLSLAQPAPVDSLIRQALSAAQDYADLEPIIRRLPLSAPLLRQIPLIFPHTF
ncbi:MAG: hypothetical protein HC880_00365 [Bacteroidia bacterium]|nr:hypothetical protein [Bacteroidia bacterium]